MKHDDAVSDALASHADDYAVVDELHDVPPYRVYEVRLDGRRAVLKIDDHPRGHAAAEGRVQEYVADRTSIPAPPVIGVGADHFVATWDDDADRGTPPLTAEWARAAGECLATLHVETEGEFDAFGVLRSDEDGFALDGRADWVSTVRDRIDHHRSYLAGVGYEDVTDAVDAFFRDRPDAFDGADGPVVCHGNFLPEHAPVRDGDVACVVDFEHALVAPGEYDYWRTATPLFAGADDVDEAIPSAFRDGYESVRPLPQGFERRRRYYSLVNLVSYLESLYLQGNVGPDERTRRAERLCDIVEDLTGGSTDSSTLSQPRNDQMFDERDR